MSVLTLWDLLRPEKRRRPPPRPARWDRTVPAPEHHGAATERAILPPSRPTMAERYESLTREMLRTHGVRVRKWRTSMSGVAWQVLYRDGTVSRLIEAPRPRGPMSCAIFLHEIGHHAIGFKTHRLRCVEEYYAWKFAINTMEQRGLNVTDSVRKRMHDSMRYAVEKARRRGLRELPEVLKPFIRPMRMEQSRV